MTPSPSLPAPTTHPLNPTLTCTLTTLLQTACLLSTQPHSVAAAGLTKGAGNVCCELCVLQQVDEEVAAHIVRCIGPPMACMQEGAGGKSVVCAGEGCVKGTCTTNHFGCWADKCSCQTSYMHAKASTAGAGQTGLHSPSNTPNRPTTSPDLGSVLNCKPPH